MRFTLLDYDAYKCMITTIIVKKKKKDKKIEIEDQLGFF